MSITGKDLVARGWPQGRAMGLAIAAGNRWAEERNATKEDALEMLDRVLKAPSSWTMIKAFSEVAEELVGMREESNRSIGVRENHVPFPVWGADYIEPQAMGQMYAAMKMEPAVAGALMADAHLGYALPVGGVWGLDNCVSPNAVGVDIGCRMHLSVYDIEPLGFLEKDLERVKHALAAETRMNAGAAFDRRHEREHPVLDDERWSTTPLLKELHRNVAQKQLGTSGGGNHFVEFGTLTHQGEKGPFLLALLSHSGSRRVGHQIAEYYRKEAEKLCARRGLPREFKDYAWVPLDEDLGREYWQAMELAGAYAKANHEIIHERVARYLGIGNSKARMVDHHHNFAYLETHHGQEMVVHRKGATPAMGGELGVIPGTMGDPGFLVRGWGNEESLCSASHGAGRAMSRRKAKERISRDEWQSRLRERGVTLMGGGLDEAPQAYKDIGRVMAYQEDLVKIEARFDPKVVRMASDGVDM